MAKLAKRGKRSRSSAQRCIDCGRDIPDHDWYKHDKKRRGLVCSNCGPGKPEMAMPKPKG